MTKTQQGIWAGLLATGPMTLAMFALQRQLPAAEKSPLPPATLTSQVMGSLGVDQRLSQNRRVDLTLINHFAYGAACGLLYAFGLQKFQASPFLKGSLFGLSVWAGSYMGWIPAFGLRANAFQMPARRNALMILAHWVWGASLAYSENQMRQYGNQMLDGRLKAPLAE